MSRNIKVEKGIKPLDKRSSWKPFDPEIGKKYYVSFQTGYAVPCILTEIYFEDTRRRYSVDVDTRKYAGSYSLFEEELGRTPQEAAINKFGLF